MVGWKISELGDLQARITFQHQQYLPV
jgi:hypothetical protein